MPPLCAAGAVVTPPAARLARPGAALRLADGVKAQVQVHAEGLCPGIPSSFPSSAFCSLLTIALYFLHTPSLPPAPPSLPALGTV